MTKTEPPSAPRKALGRGLGALVPPRRAPLGTDPPDHFREPAMAEGLATIPLDQIDPNPYQPRQVFDPERLQELAQSLKAQGLIQPIVVRRHRDRYILIVGERRWRAARLTGMKEIPAIVREIPEDRLLEVTLIENIQREDLNPMEASLAFQRMSQELGYSHEEIARRTGKERATITNFLRLLKLPADVQQLVAERRISMGHARAILAMPEEGQQRALAEKAIAQGLSVRQTERLVQRLLESREPADAQKDAVDPNVAAAQREMEEALGTRVRVVEKSGDKGKIEIEYYSMDDLNRIYAIIVKAAAAGKS